jgi:hypothetical protein
LPKTIPEKWKQKNIQKIQNQTKSTSSTSTPEKKLSNVLYSILIKKMSMPAENTKLGWENELNPVHTLPLQTTKDHELKLLHHSKQSVTEELQRINT